MSHGPSLYAGCTGAYRFTATEIETSEAGLDDFDQCFQE